VPKPAAEGFFGVVDQSHAPAPLPVQRRGTQPAPPRVPRPLRPGAPPRLADGIWLRVWRGGPQAGQPKIPAAVAGLLDRGLMELGPDTIGFRARFTPAGIAALRLLAQDRRALHPKQYAHVREQLGLEQAAADSGTDP